MLTKDHFKTNRRLCATGKCDRCETPNSPKQPAQVLYDFGNGVTLRYCGDHYERFRFPVEPSLAELQAQVEAAIA